MIKIYTSIYLKFEKIQYPIIIIKRAPRLIHKHAILSKVHGVTLHLIFYTNNNNIENNNTLIMEFLQMSNRVIFNMAGLPDIFTPSIRPRYRAFNETQYASVQYHCHVTVTTHVSMAFLLVLPHLPRCLLQILIM